jgi:hypothetical protein
LLDQAQKVLQNVAGRGFDVLLQVLEAPAAYSSKIVANSSFRAVSGSSTARSFFTAKARALMKASSRFFSKIF